MRALIVFRLRAAASLILALSLAGCGTNMQDRATGGAATGATTGAVIGLLGGPFGVVAGALVGAGVGATTGATVDSSHLNLGTPPWSNQQSEQR